MQKHILALLLAVFMMAALPAFADDDDSVVGTIMAVEGDVVVKHDGEKTVAGVKTPVHLKDTVLTGENARALILMIDDTQVTLGQKAKFVVNTYVFDEEKKEANSASYSILDGAFSYVSGLMGKTTRPDVKINTTAGSIGIRGTVLFAGPVGSQYGVFLQQGGIDVTNGGGGVVLEQGEGTDIGGKGQKPGTPGAWPKDKIQKLKNLVKLKDPAGAKSRIGAFKGKQKQLRQRHKKFLKTGKKYSLRLRYMPLDTQPPGAQFIPCIGGRRGGGC